MCLFKRIPVRGIFYFVIISNVLSKAINKVSMNGRCGENDGICREGYCCSKLGWCGNSDLHCSIENGCQSEFGLCKGDTARIAEEPKEVSMDGRCGEGLPVCREGFCCSKWGWCGNTDLHCAIENGCLSEFGSCKGQGVGGNSNSTSNQNNNQNNNQTNHQNNNRNNNQNNNRNNHQNNNRNNHQDHGSSNGNSEKKEITPSYKTCSPNNSNHLKGVCVKTSDCVLKNGQVGTVQTYKGFCLSDPEDVLCCVKTVDTIDGNSLVNAGVCMNASECPTDVNTLVKHQCPGNADIQLCVYTPNGNLYGTNASIASSETTAPAPEKHVSKEKSDVCPGKKIIIDISHHQKVKDYDTLAKMYDGIIIRVGDFQGDTDPDVIDDLWEKHFNNLKGKTNIGFYFFTRARTPDRIEKHVETVYNMIKDKLQYNSFPLYIDMEKDEITNKTYMNDECYNIPRRFLNLYCDKEKDNTIIAIAGIKKIQKLGLRAGIYTNLFDSSKLFELNNSLLKYDDIKETGASIWIARHGIKPKQEKYDIWQYTKGDISQSIIDGGEVDKDCLYKNGLIKN